MISKRALFFSVFICIISWIVFSCTSYVNHSFRQSYSNANEIIHSDLVKTPFLKMHFKNGDVSMLDTWKLNEKKDSIVGNGKLYDFNRQPKYKGDLVFAIDDIAIIETNDLTPLQSKDGARVAALTILTGADVLIAAVCLANPKACFGSCPTFYVDENSSFHYSNAEGFSSSTSPCFEEKDLDPLQYSTASSEFFLTMKNEALESHMVNELYIEAVPKNKDETVFVDQNNTYYTSSRKFNPTKAEVNNQSIKSDILHLDDHEYFSTTDSTDLFAQEEIIVEFDNLPDGDLGLALNYRQTQLTTFLFYSALSYMGNEVSDFVARMETSYLTRKVVENHLSKFGKIKLSYWDERRGKWNYLDELKEKGPIAKNLILSRIPNKTKENNKVKVKIEMTRGLWRLDYVGLHLIDKKASPTIIFPSAIEVIDGVEYPVDQILTDDKAYIVSFPGNEYKFKFDLPELEENKEHEIFLSSKGYYLEWMRKSWLEGKDTEKLNKLLFNDSDSWKEMAIEFKEMEHEMESTFWNSKYSRVQ
ncbi:MAG: hypothetical protein P1U56_05780 [Saprospiraceae bacterium]|nr:hypothetical protein [Saprospiraceae bacterium]